MLLFSSTPSNRHQGKSIVFAFFCLSFFFILNTTAHLSLDSCDDPYKVLKLTLNPDGTVTRPYDPKCPPSPDPSLPIEVLSKDLTINQSKGTWARIYLPRKALDLDHHGSIVKLPLLLFFHGGGFIIFSAASTMGHDFCFGIARDVEAVVVSVEYRLAPEHRLPAAYDDAVEALQWIKRFKSDRVVDDWLTNHVDYSNVFLMGSSAGGNIAYHAGLRVAAEADDDDDENFKIQGMILSQPFFGGIQRTSSELRLANEPHLPLCNTDMMWVLSLPVGADRDHEYANPRMGDSPAILEMIKRLGWRVLVTGCDHDQLVDRQLGLVKLLEEKGVSVVGYFTVGDYHGIYEDVPLKAKQLCRVIKNFIGNDQELHLGPLGLNETQSF